MPSASSGPLSQSSLLRKSWREIGELGQQTAGSSKINETIPYISYLFRMGSLYHLIAGGVRLVNDEEPWKRHSNPKARGLKNKSKPVVG